MLDWTHGLVLRAVAQGDHGDCPALRTLIAAGLVAQQPDGSHVVTPAGEVALQHDQPTRSERIVWAVAAVGGALLVVATIGEWVS
ncbi:MAG: hypothetical protein Q8O56_10865 [Solirubrobacteraceae bacterium]|nr:hypothetical protein [Solirubrobacteraceae bacterium]